MVLLPTDKQCGFRGTIDKDWNKAVAEGQKAGNPSNRPFLRSTTSRSKLSSRRSSHSSPVVLQWHTSPVDCSSDRDAYSESTRVPLVRIRRSFCYALGTDFENRAMERENQPPVTGPSDAGDSQLEAKNNAVSDKDNDSKKARGTPLASLDTNISPQLAYTAEPSTTMDKVHTKDGGRRPTRRASRIHGLKSTVDIGEEKVSETVDGEVSKIVEDNAKEISAENGDGNGDQGSKEREPAANTAHEITPGTSASQADNNNQSIYEAVESGENRHQPSTTIEQSSSAVNEDGTEASAATDGLPVASTLDYDSEPSNFDDDSDDDDQGNGSDYSATEFDSDIETEVEDNAAAPIPADPRALRRRETTIMGGMLRRPGDGY
ncbi:hypothetical protein NMY22_g13529 [Coprinellus aureogranulatus]|nr:hypothetical protein NMY22_g13529 [Coprinellus aureogranulatus]